MKLVVGLGNPGKKYQYHRHNIGFLTVDYLGKRYGLFVSKLKFQSLWHEIRIDGEKVILLKPITYMNRSGHAVRLWKDYFDLQNKYILIIHDDLDLDFCQVKMRPGGGAAGHKGVKSLITNLGGQDFPRIRFGIGQSPPEMEPSNYVLKDFSREEYAELTEKLSQAADGIEIFCRKGIDQAMNFLNSAE